MIGRKDQKAMVLPTIFLIIVIASILMAITISQASSNATGDEPGSVATEGKAFWHKDIKNKTWGGNDKMEKKKAK